MGTFVDRTPKCTPALAGEGTEYCWACAKGWYRVQSLSRKRDKAHVHVLVKE